MADENSRYTIEVKLTITDVTTGQTVPDFSDVILHQYNQTYEQMQGFQEAIVGAVLGTLAAAGQETDGAIKGKRGQGQSKQDDKFAR
jgi:hypothetical protein